MPTIISYNKRLHALRSERSSFMAYWRELSDNHLAFRGRFLTSDRNKGHKRDTKMFNNTSRMANRTLASGMMAGITSPARPWFRLSTSDEELRNSAAVVQWLHDSQEIIYEVFSQSNVYNSLHQLYSEIGVFGTAAMGVFEDFDNVIRCQTYTVGSYMLATNGKDIVDTFYREYEISVSQCVKEFGFENCSSEVQQRWDKGNTESWVSVVHLIEPNDDRDMQSPLASDMKFRSVYYEAKSGNPRFKERFLRKSGFDEFPVLAPRWEVTYGDIYATDCPGMTTLGDTKALQLGERRKYQALDKLVDPPLQGPSNLKNKVGGSLRNGEIVWTETGEALSSIYGNYRPDLNAMMAINQETQLRIKTGFFEDLFLMLANTDRRQITAREIAEKHEEKLLMLGPVLERMHNELLDPLINRTFALLQRGGILPPPPPELENTELRVEYVSVLAQAQRLVSLGAIERLADYTSTLAAVWPEARHKFDASQSIDEYADALGTTPKILRSDEEATGIVAAEQQAAAQQAAMVQGQAMADAGKTLSETDTGEGNALSDVMQRAGLA